MRINELQLSLETSRIEFFLKKLDRIENEQELKAYLDTLELLELLEIYYFQSYEIRRIRDVILNS